MKTLPLEDTNALATQLLARLEGRDLTPEEQARVDEVRSRIPPATDEEMIEHARREEQRYADQQREWERSRKLRAIEESGVRLQRGDYAAIAAGDYAETDAVRRVREWWSGGQDGSILCMVGGTGLGKTFAAATLVAEHGGRGVRSKHLARLCGSTWSEHVTEFEALLSHPGLVVVDDVGTEPNAEAAKAMLFELIDERQGARGRTILTSNLALKGDGGLASRLCERTLSRLHGCGAFYGLQGDDLRKRGAQ